MTSRARKVREMRAKAVREKWSFSKYGLWYLYESVFSRWLRIQIFFSIFAHYDVIILKKLIFSQIWSKFDIKQPKKALYNAKMPK